MKNAGTQARSASMMYNPYHIIRGLMLLVMLGIFGLLAYVAYPTSQSRGTQQRFKAGNSRSSHTSSSRYSRNYVYDVPPIPSTPTLDTSGVQGVISGNTKITQLAHLLPLTNFSSLTSAQILDAAISKASSHQRMWQMMQDHQRLFCAAEMHLKPSSGIKQVPFGNVTLHVYDGKDIVSDQLAGVQHTWEASEIQQMLWGLRQYAAQQQQAVQNQQRRQQQNAAVDKMPLFVDVGANVGWFALNAAAAGARVAAFEAMPSNIELIRRSLCYNPWLADRFALYGTGLGSSSSSCAIISGSTNRGDGHTICGQDVQEYLEQHSNGSNDTYEVRGEMSVRRLDTIIAEDVQVMKIDVEGFELQVLEGAERLLATHNVWYIMAECNGGIITPEGQKKYLRFMDKMGYFISIYSFTGPFIKPKRIAAGTADIPEFANLYCVKKELLSPGIVQHLMSADNIRVGDLDGSQTNRF